MIAENELKKLKTFYSVYVGSSFEEDGTQNYLVFQSMYRFFKRVSGVGSGNYIYFGNLKDCLMKILQFQLQVIKASICN